MSIKRSFILSGIAAILLTSACTPGKELGDIDGQYWERVNVAEAVYIQGPKAQQTLNRDIARCVSELKELERLGAVKNPIPADRNGRVLDPDQHALNHWDTPERDGASYAEHSDYHDFEGCMLSKGWERVKFVGFKEDEQSRQNYLRSHVDYKYRTKVGDKDSSSIYDDWNPKEDQGDYGDLNE